MALLRDMSIVEREEFLTKVKSALLAFMAENEDMPYSQVIETVAAEHSWHVSAVALALSRLKCSRQV